VKRCQLQKSALTPSKLPKMLKKSYRRHLFGFSEFYYTGVALLMQQINAARFRQPLSAHWPLSLLHTVEDNSLSRNRACLAITVENRRCQTWLVVISILRQRHCHVSEVCAPYFNTFTIGIQLILQCSVVRNAHLLQKICGIFLDVY